MTTHRLTLHFAPGDLAVVKAAGQRLVLGRAVDGDEPGRPWCSVDPTETTEVSWADELGLYVSPSAAPVTKVAEITAPAMRGATYTFRPDTTFSGPGFGDAVEPDSYGVRNDVPYSTHPSLVFGLTQTVVVNDRTIPDQPVCGAVVLSTQVARFTPEPVVHVWLEARLATEAVRTVVRGTATRVAVGPSTPHVALAYDPELGTFLAVDEADVPGGHAAP